MKRKWVWLALPMLLAALMLGVKWRAEHPRPSQQDWQIRALMRQSSETEIDYFPKRGTQTPLVIKVPKAELDPLIDSFFASRQAAVNLKSTTGAQGKIGVYWFLKEAQPDGANGVLINIDIAKGQGTFHFGNSNTVNESDVHPVTSRRWLEFLLAHPRIGPRLLARLK